VAQPAGGRLAETGMRAEGECLPASVGPLDISDQSAERITAEEVANRLGTINYEVTCALTPRVPRLYHRDGEAI